MDIQSGTIRIGGQHIELLVQQALWELMQGRTALVVTHRLSTVAGMDRLVVLDHGRIVDTGTHQELLSAEGTYAQLWRYQSGGFLGEQPRTRPWSVPPQ